MSRHRLWRPYRFLTRRTRLYARDVANVIRYGSNAPLSAQRIYVDPRKIEYTIAGGGLTRRHTGSVMNGDWDLEVKPVDELQKVAICYRHFVDGKSWKDSGAYAYMLNLIELQPGVDGCYTENDVFRRYERLDSLFLEVAQE